jgi:hypothetical protein
LSNTPGPDVAPILQDSSASVQRSEREAGAGNGTILSALEDPGRLGRTGLAPGRIHLLMPLIDG